MKIDKKKISYIGVYFLFFISLCSSQPSAKYRPFDWLLFKEPGSINSISEGYEFLYIGTSHGGIYRYNLYGNQYDFCLLYTSPSPRDKRQSRMPSSA